MTDAIIIAVVAVIIVVAALYIRRAKKSGQKCIGCPESKTCASHCGSCSGCSGHSQQ